MENYSGSDFVNVGSGKDLSIKELALMIKEIVGFEGSVVFDTSKPDGTPRKLMDVGRINGLGWKYKIELEDGIRSVYNELIEADYFGQLV